MSRSYRKTPMSTQRNKGHPQGPLDKRLAARAVRAARDVPSGASFRRLSNPWDICDWKFYCPDDPKARRK